MTHHETTTKGVGLARGPALVLGAILSVFGLILFIKCGDDLSTSGFADGDPVGQKFLGFEANGWTAWITTAAGALLLFGAAQHLLAKATSLIVALVLGACAILGAVEGDVLGLAASNIPTWVGWAIAAILLFFNLFAPRIEHDHDDVDHDRRRFGRRREAGPVGPAAGTRDHDPVITRDRDHDAGVAGTRSSEDETRPLGTTPPAEGETRSSDVRRGT
jgi:hypothetical protein